jgi:hypothetical protein
MMYLPFILTALLETQTPTIDIVDSRDDNKITYIILNNTCKVAVNKADLKDYDRIVESVFRRCGFKYGSWLYQPDDSSVR